MNDEQIRQQFHRESLRRHHDDSETVVVDELGLKHGRCRADIAVINGHFTGYEIKSDNDSLRRLPVQIDVYSAVFDRASVIVGEKHACAVKSLIPFRAYLRDQGIQNKVPFHLPHRLAAARAGMGTFGKNCLFYSNQVVAKGSWVLPIAVVVDQEFAPDEPSLEVGCPDWCRNTCLVACPTGALKGPRHIDPYKCISYLTYFGQGLTPLELREPMGLWVYGCDRCQNVCPRNAPWLARDLPMNQKVAAMVEDFRLEKLLHMDVPYFNDRVWPHMFYMSDKDLWRWKMNVARAMGNTLDDRYIPGLAKAFTENGDERVLGMIAWALGRVGGPEAKRALEDGLLKSEGLVREEIVAALEKK